MKHPTYPSIAAIALLGCITLSCSPEQKRSTAKVAQCQDSSPTATRWLSWKPRVPLAISDKTTLQTAGTACCVPWSHKGETWRAIDAWGQVLGTAQVTDSTEYDVTKCRELALAPKTLAQKAVVFASAHGSWAPKPSTQWLPSSDERSQLARAINNVQVRFTSKITTKMQKPPFQPMFFQFPSAHNSQQPTKFAVVGGPVLVVAYLTTASVWKTAYIHHARLSQYSPPNPYTPIAVFDMDHDGDPEVLYQGSEGTSWSVSVLKVKPNTRTSWFEAAKGIGGATI